MKKTIDSLEEKLKSEQEEVTAALSKNVTHDTINQHIHGFRSQLEKSTKVIQDESIKIEQLKGAIFALEELLRNV